MGHIFFLIQIHENMTFWTNFGQILRLIQGTTLEALNFFSEILMVHRVGSAILSHSIAAGQIGFHHVSITS